MLNTGLVSVLILSWDLSWFSDPVLNTGLINLDISSRVQKDQVHGLLCLLLHSTNAVRCVLGAATPGRS